MCGDSIWRGDCFCKSVGIKDFFRLIGVCYGVCCCVFYFLVRECGGVCLFLVLKFMLSGACLVRFGGVGLVGCLCGECGKIM